MLEKIELKIKHLEPFYEPNCLHGIFSWQEFENLLNLRPFVNSDRVNFSEYYEWSDKAWLTDVNSFPPQVIQDYLEKSSGHIVDCSRVNKNINIICNELDMLTNCPTDAHIYFDLSKTKKGFGIHFDFSHNLILQIEGTSKLKLWNVKENKPELRNIEDVGKSPSFDVIMEPGDVFYVPAFYYHEVQSITKRLSISFPSATFFSIPAQEREWVKLNL